MSRIALPAPDAARAPHTGWGREHLLRVADAILAGASRHASPSGALVRYPGAPGGYGARVDALEGFARTFLLAAFRIAGDPAGTAPLAERYARGIAAGVDPSHAERWPRPDEVDQAKVESAALALGLHLTREQVWARLGDVDRSRVIDYLAGFVGGSYPPNNWAWFRIVVETFLASVGGPHRAADLEQDLALLDSFELEGGWSSDGAGRAFDHYCGWALPFYPVLWADMVGDDPRLAPRLTRARDRLDDYLDDALHLIGSDGAPLIQGRSLTYRFATAGAAWAAVYGGSTRHDLGALRRAAVGQVAHFVEHDAPGADGVLALGWHGPWRALAQNYSGPGSPYWAAKGLLGIALAADHPVWSATEQPLPVERGPFARVLHAPGWLATGTPDGVVRVTNHGTDHREAGDRHADGPLYARLAYSTATSPVLAGPMARDPRDAHAGLVRGGSPSHRSGFVRGALADLGDQTLLGGSTARAHWAEQLAGDPDHGSGDRILRAVTGALVDTVSVVRGAWEVRFSRIRDDNGDHDGVLWLGGWPLSAARPGTDAGSALSARLASRALALTPGRAGVADAGDAGPLAGDTSIPHVVAPASGEWSGAAFALGEPDSVARAPALARHDSSWRIHWPDGPPTDLDPSSAVPAGDALRPLQ
ncbi:DUF2264 domain-containing protein [Microbacterium excoecariae]|uniref:DUF2264 domain-containing protein n=1 Tax=Microbacterium excoecariae TaxID=2715210 RepID=UPI00140D7336|nr:DUF2264 domain-containing protein [Microbacterium excoecariae]NHI16600.1 DUF2264 domain-containing protein [Microbacterium excoecariae]